MQFNDIDTILQRKGYKFDRHYSAGKKCHAAVVEKHLQFLYDELFTIQRYLKNKKQRTAVVTYLKKTYEHAVKVRSASLACLLDRLGLKHLMREGFVRISSGSRFSDWPHDKAEGALFGTTFIASKLVQRAYQYLKFVNKHQDYDDDSDVFNRALKSLKPQILFQMPLGLYGLMADPFTEQGKPGFDKRLRNTMTQARTNNRQRVEGAQQNFWDKPPSGSDIPRLQRKGAYEGQQNAKLKGHYGQPGDILPRLEKDAPTNKLSTFNPAAFEVPNNIQRRMTRGFRRYAHNGTTEQLKQVRKILSNAANRVLQANANKKFVKSSIYVNGRNYQNFYGGKVKNRNAKDNP